MRFLIYIVIGFIAILGSLNQCFAAKLENNKNINEDWKEAVIKWSAFANEHMERMRKHDATLPRAKLPDYKFDMKWVEVKSRLITKYLPNYKIFADRRFEFALDKQGHIICLGETWPLDRLFKSVPDFELKKYSDFIRELKILVKDAQTAIEMVKLRDIIYTGNGYIDDKELELRKQNWKYKARKKKGVWFVEMEFVGPAWMSITMPPIWKIIVDENNNVKAIKEVHLGFCDVNGDGDCNLDDVKALEKLIGECIPGSTKFNIIADTDRDGCITESDRDLLLKEISE